jgi:hypothetical protein
LAYKEIDPLTGKRKKSGGRIAGVSVNRTTSARMAAMARVNEALNQLGEDTLSGMRLLQEVIRSKDCPLDVRIQCSGLLLKHEMPLDVAQQYVTRMPPSFPANEQGMAMWWALYSGTENDDPEWQAAVKRILELAATRTAPKALQ